jgi:hypothetical protein
MERVKKDGPRRCILTQTKALCQRAGKAADIPEQGQWEGTAWHTRISGLWLSSAAAA